MSSFLDFLTRWRGGAKPDDAPEGDSRVVRRTGASRSKDYTPLADEAFLAFISHELRTPLNAIIGYSEILQEDAVFLEQKDFLPDLQKIQKASEHLIALVDDIIDLSRLEAGKMDLQIEKFDAASLVKDVTADTRALVDRTFCTLEVAVAPEVAEMTADRAKVQRGLSNLIRHVCGVARQGPMRLEAGTEVRGEERWVRFSLSHPDLLLKPKELEALIDGGTRAGARGLPQYHGSGLGLVITQRFCGLMGGEFAVAPLGSTGMTLTMALPETVRPVA